ncbi:unnamed protein product [Brachionus calyciflorus]|uniref:DDHD domain-containing protein n=1 Tax=Brachionus calyciflorus TaxID=104777 RepID=A0A813MAL8_9BILA|nr:unnamed protein product [Brachionus calyciflorus]
MLIIEYRMILPFNVDEYNVANMYTIQKKSRLESAGPGNGVEVIENKPYVNEKNESGQYSHKIYYIEQRLPSSIRSVAKFVFSKNALYFEEETWNFFPYVKSKFKHPVFKSFNIEIETRYTKELGQIENIFNLSGRELSDRTVDHVDFVNDPIGPNEYKSEEDPLKFSSPIGNLKPNWLEELKRNSDLKTNQSMINNKTINFMCIYKLCKLDIPIMGYQSKIEKTVAETAMRNLMITAQRQCWVWQSEYRGMSIETLRRLEIETQEYLRKKIRGEPVEEIDMTQIEEKDSSDDEASGNSSDEFYDCVSMLDLPMRKVERNTKRKTFHRSTIRRKSYPESFKNADKLINQSSDTLILIAHAGNVTCTEISSESDLIKFKSTMNMVRENYPQCNNRIYYRLVNCDQICKEALLQLSMLSGSSSNDSLTDDSVLTTIHDNIPYNTLPLLINQNKYKESLKKFIGECNSVYSKLLASFEATSFQGQIILVADGLGALLAYDSLSNQCEDEVFNFKIDQFFCFGSPLGLVLTQRKILNGNLKYPECSQIFNIFHLNDPNSMRIEPLLCDRFKCIDPISVRRNSIDSTASLDIEITKYEELFDPNRKLEWWGKNRIDYAINSPVGSMLKKSPYSVYYNHYWKSHDIAQFILMQIFKIDRKMSVIMEEKPEKSPEPIIERKKNLMKTNHRANDIIVQEAKDQILVARFCKGPLDFSLSNEKVDIYIKSEEILEWKYLATETTDEKGKLYHAIPWDKRLPIGVYQIKMIVKSDLSGTHFYMTVIPEKCEAVVFSIDDTLITSSKVLTRKNPKLRPGAVDIVRYWQSLGYIIIYITSKSDTNHLKITNLLTQHNFPLGMVYSSDGITLDSTKQKIETLKSISEHLKLSAAYGSTNEIQVYTNLGVETSRIFILSNKSKTKLLNQGVRILSNGYSHHLNELHNSKDIDGELKLVGTKKSIHVLTRRSFFNQ